MDPLQIKFCGFDLKISGSWSWTRCWSWSRTHAGWTGGRAGGAGGAGAGGVGRAVKKVHCCFWPARPLARWWTAGSVKTRNSPQPTETFLLCVLLRTWEARWEFPGISNRESTTAPNEFVFYQDNMFCLGRTSRSSMGV